jgi:predicted transposase/invertase (TIGR01784 family)
MSTINPRVDIAFKKIFGVEENKDLLISLINSVVGKEDQVSDVTLLNPYTLKNYREERSSILDIKAKSQKGKHFNIEMQILDEGDYDKRALFYWAKLYTEQLSKGDDFFLLSKTIGIHILNFTSIPTTDKYHNVFHITEKDSGIHYFKDLELHTIELKKFSENPREELNDLVARVKSSLDMWVAFLTRHDLLDKEHLPPQLNSPTIKKALDVIEVMSMSPEEREVYEGRLKWLRLEASALKKHETIGFEKGLEKGEAIGFEKGEAIGFEKGEVIGFEKGEAIGFEKRNIEVAKTLVAYGIDLEIISSTTGFSLEEIKTICPDASYDIPIVSLG